MTHALLISVFVIASCGLVYELIAGTLASYLPVSYTHLDVYKRQVLGHQNHR